MAAAVALPFVADAYTVSIASTGIVLALLAMSTQLLTGIAGLPSLGQAAYLGVGAYTAALLATSGGVSNGPVQLAAGMAAGAAAAAVTAPLLLRTRGVLFLMASLAVAELTRAVAAQWSSVTGGDDGLHTPPVTIWPGTPPLNRDGYTYLYALGVLLILAAAVAVMLRSRLVLALRAAADHELRLAALGYEVDRHLFAGAVAAGAVAGAGGALLVAAHQFLSPADLGLSVSAMALLAAAIGRGSMRGAVAGAVLVVAVRDRVGTSISGHADALLGLAFLLVAYQPIITRRLRERRQARNRGHRP
ncbi:branched-chain amino acid ABC transporter permease [Dactylosporangium sp. AC04546]|uniref:branched-chain amino acid ABC transporter permease n=1 Tax=Dactylosporangium sp. AC04546 TaxID=2862460 RepID=UPI001EDCDBF6|nr:branched-chain amino acid ABC transporter permease [Dactylosporangium sp. AC04546]WVK78886.1 branched-chain amino acid ABC transporter permease [Dactylosporangium sp. AC04546]